MRISKKLVLLSSFLIAIIWFAPANEGLYAVSEQLYTENGVNHALIIGIGDYDEWDKLESPSKDAAEIARILTEKYNFKEENVTLLNDDSKEKPEQRTIFSYLDNYLNSLTDNDNLLIFYSGHSTEDEDGETYWIPKDANKSLKISWLSHSDICNVIGSEDFKAKNVIIITDSLFSKSLLKSSSLSLFPEDPRYSEKIVEKASKRSREVISFGDKHWAGSDKTEGFGLFTYFFRKVLMDNWFKVIDFENLFYDEEMILQIRKIAGAKLVQGRLKTSPMEEGGQAIITRVVSPPEIDITEAYVNPDKGYAGDEFIIDAVTSRSAVEVYVELDGKKKLMDGEGTEWRYSLKVGSIGKSTFRVLAVNEDFVEGKSQKGEIETIAPLTGMVSVTDAQVNPKQGEGGDEFTFTAKTDSSAKKVQLRIGDNRYNMTGSGTSWSLKQKVEESGSVTFSMVAINENDVEGRAETGVLSVKAPEINIVTLDAPETGYAGDEFLITASTDFPARSVELKLGDRTYDMQDSGSGKEWQLKREIPDIGTIPFTVAAINTEGISGSSKGGEILTTERPAGIPDIASVSTGKVFAGEDFSIRVKTTADAEEVLLELDGKSVSMEGSGTDWRYPTQIASVGTATYKIIARNKDGIQGRSEEGKISITEKVGIEIAQEKVDPQKGILGGTFTFTATTAESAKSVAVVIGEKRYDMTGSGTNWSFAQKIEDVGTIDYYMVATDDEGQEGSSKGGSFVTEALLANVIGSSASSPNNFTGEEFLFTVNTDNPATSVSLEMDGVTYDMEGSGTTWQYKKTIHDIGTKEYTVLAKNIEGKTGKTESKDLVVKLAIPDVTEVAFSTDPIYAEETFSINVKTNTNAEQVLVNIAGTDYPMMGSGTDWAYTAQIPDVGPVQYNVVAKNRDGTDGQPKTGTIEALKKPAAFINVVQAAVSPELGDVGYAGMKFTFTASTDMPAVGAVLKIKGQEYPMTGSGTNWSLDQKIEEAGDQVAYSIAAINEDNLTGIAKTGTFDVQELTERYTKNEDGSITDKTTGEAQQRFVDNGDGTITDLFSNLMWAQSPKRLVASYEEAEEYCNELSKEDYTGWRIPTASELNDLMDKSQEAPALPLGNPFKNVSVNEGFWSKTKHKTLANRIYVADLYYGEIKAQSMDNLFYVWPVRAAE